MERPPRRSNEGLCHPFQLQQQLHEEVTREELACLYAAIRNRIDRRLRQVEMQIVRQVRNQQPIRIEILSTRTVRQDDTGVSRRALLGDKRHQNTVNLRNDTRCQTRGSLRHTRQFCLERLTGVMEGVIGAVEISHLNPKVTGREVVAGMNKNRRREHYFSKLYKSGWRVMRHISIL